MANSDVTQKGISYLINQRGEILAASSQENLDELSGKEAFPGHGRNSLMAGAADGRKRLSLPSEKAGAGGMDAGFHHSQTGFFTGRLI